MSRAVIEEDARWQDLMGADSPETHGYQAIKKKWERDCFLVVSSTNERYAYWPDKSEEPTLYCAAHLQTKFKAWTYWVLNEWTNRYSPRPFVSVWIKDDEKRFEPHCIVNPVKRARRHKRVLMLWEPSEC